MCLPAALAPAPPPTLSPLLRGEEQGTCKLHALSTQRCRRLCAECVPRVFFLLLRSYCGVCTWRTSIDVCGCGEGLWCVCVCGPPFLLLVWMVWRIPGRGWWRGHSGEGAVRPWTQTRPGHSAPLHLPPPSLPHPSWKPRCAQMHRVHRKTRRKDAKGARKGTSEAEAEQRRWMGVADLSRRHAGFCVLDAVSKRQHGQPWRPPPPAPRG